MAKFHSIYGIKIILAVSYRQNRDIERISEDVGATLIVVIEMHS
jgi:hypothetical protein